MVNKKYILTPLALFILPFLIYAQTNPKSDNLTSRLKAYVNNLALEKTYLQTDRERYATGDTIWFKAYVVNGIPHFTNAESKVVYVELMGPNDSLVAQRKLYFEGSGAFGDLQIDGTLAEGDYSLRAYTRYMLNKENPIIFRKSISILKRHVPIIISYPSVAEDIKDESPKTEDPFLEKLGPEVQFFPEGGHLVMGLESEMGLKITNGLGNGLALNGRIVDQTGKNVASFQTHDFGLGTLTITPKTGKRYRAEIIVSGIPYYFPVPSALDSGYVLQLKNRGPQIIIQISSSMGHGLKGALLVGHLRGEVFLKHAVDNSKNSHIISIPTSALSDGVAHFTLFDPKGEPVCERLTFIENPDNGTELVLKTDKTNYLPREKVELDISLFDVWGKPLQGDFSIGVALGNGLIKGTPHIKSWLLLHSDIEPTLEDPNYFFEEKTMARKNLLDAAMLVQGGSRFVWKPFLRDSLDLVPKFPAEKGILIQGKTTSLDNPDQPKKSTVTMSILGPEIYQEKMTTDDQGKFSFGPFVFQDSVRAVINTSAPLQNKKGLSDLAVHIDPVPTVPLADPTGPTLPKKTVAFKEDLREYRKHVADLPHDRNTIELSEAVVRAKKKTKRERMVEELNKMTLHGPATNRLFPDSIPGLRTSSSVFDIIRNIPGVEVIGTSVRIRGITSFAGGVAPLFTLDGVPVSPEFIKSMPIAEVLFVDVLKGNEAAIYGAKGANGVIAIYTDRGMDFGEPHEKKYPNATGFFVQGFYKAREFYSPNYSEKIPGHQLPDYRTTLYWNPEVILNKGTPTKLNFHTGDVAGKYTVRVAGITMDGRPVSGQCSFYVSD